MMPIRKAVLSLMAPLALCVAFCAQAQAQSNPVVVELYTSQGCSSCPPADALLHKLAEREDVIALALHVDYWDYIGWKDAFARPEHAERQRKFALVAGRRSVYTPQMIINGQDSVVGARGMEVADTIRAHQARQTGVRVTATRRGNFVRISGEAPKSAGPMQVILAQYEPRQSVNIRRGENAGRSLTYANIVRSWDVVAEWRGAAPLSIEVPLDDSLRGAVIVQSAGHGPVQAAAHIR